jgi:stringent starvation protein B
VEGGETPPEAASPLPPRGAAPTARQSRFRSARLDEMLIMATGHSLDNQGTSTRPYLLRALHDWCTDNGFTPYIAVYVDATVQVPMEYVKNNEIVLNVGFEATSSLKLGNEYVEFKARFGGSARDIVVPIDHVVAIYARENGQGMAFPVPTDGGAGKSAGPVAVPAPSSAAPASGGAARGPTPLRGLRLASTEPEVLPDPAAGDDASPPADEPPDPPGAPARPSLKRIK